MVHARPDAMAGAGDPHIRSKCGVRRSAASRRGQIRLADLQSGRRFRLLDDRLLSSVTPQSAVLSAPPIQSSLFVSL